MPSYAESFIWGGSNDTFIVPIVSVLFLAGFALLYSGGQEYYERERQVALKMKRLQQEQEQLQQLQYNMALDKNNPEIREQVAKAMEQAKRINNDPSPLPAQSQNVTTSTALDNEREYLTDIQFSAHPRPNITTVIRED
ncbi:hypothetical protein BGZ94_003534 [Podila epigama]|nr:hypothetical protein BGZ94_003534 [Podila epigama]